jgi:hypothetical protein
MYITTKYIIEFHSDKENETFCLCDSILCVKQYLKEKFNIEVEIKETEGYLLTLPLEYGSIRVRKIDVVQDEVNR